VERTPEPELMDSPEQVEAYASADFAEAHDQLIDAFRARFPDASPRRAIDLGCGPADVTVRFARAFPNCEVLGVDAGPNMLAAGRRAVEEAGLADRVALREARLPRAELPHGAFDAVISNSLLHHLTDPGALWQTVRAVGAPGAAVLVMDLKRPASEAAARELIQRHAGDAPAVLRDDFDSSLHAAYEPDEVCTQLAEAGLALTVETISDRHLLVWGQLDG